MIESIESPQTARQVLDGLVLKFKGDPTEAASLAGPAFRLTTLLLHREEPRWNAIGLAARAGLTPMLFGHSMYTAIDMKTELLELLQAAAELLGDPSEARELLGPYASRIGLNPHEVTASAPDAEEPGAVLRQERDADDPYDWGEQLAERMMERWSPEGGPMIAGGSDGFDDEFDDYDDDYEYGDRGPEAWEPRGCEDVDLPRYPPTTHLEAENLLERVMEIVDPARRGLRLDELLALLDQSPLKTASMAKLRAQLIEAKADAS